MIAAKTFVLIAMMLHVGSNPAPDHLHIQPGFNTKAECMAAGKQWEDDQRVLYGDPYYTCPENG